MGNRGSNEVRRTAWGQGSGGGGGAHEGVQDLVDEGGDVVVEGVLVDAAQVDDAVEWPRGNVLEDEGGRARDHAFTLLRVIRLRRHLEQHVRFDACTSYGSSSLSPSAYSSN